MILKERPHGKQSVSTCESILSEVVLRLQTKVISLHTMKVYGPWKYSLVTSPPPKET